MLCTRDMKEKGKGAVLVLGVARDQGGKTPMIDNHDRQTN